MDPFNNSFDNENNNTEKPETYERPETPQGQWYSVSYSTPQPAVKRGGKAWIAVLAVAAVLLVALALFGGALLGRYWLSTTPTDTAEITADESKNSNTNALTQVGAGYDYSGVEITQRSADTLTGSTTGSAGENAKTLIEAVAAVRDSVVEITATATSSRGTVSAGAGSGVIVHEDGIIVTNNHVVEGYTSIYVRLTNGNTYPATVRGRDEEGDIAVLKIDPTETLTVAKLGTSSALALGEEVFAIGNPLGELGGTVTRGIISNTAREIKVDDNTMTLLQTDAAINAGNSGGGLFNLAGELIGIVNAKYSATGVEGLGFAIPIDVARVSVNTLLQYGYIRGIPSLGVTVDNGYVQTSWMRYRAVVYVVEAQTGSALQANDIIVSIDGQEISDAADVKTIVRSHSVGDVLSVKVTRNNETQTVQVTLVEYIPASN